MFYLGLAEQIGPNGDIEYLAEMGGILRFCEIQIDDIKLYKSLKELHVDVKDVQSDVTYKKQELEVCFICCSCLCLRLISIFAVDNHLLSLYVSW